MTQPTMNLLWSYAYAHRIDIAGFVGELKVDRVRFFADSGAHTARTLGKHLDVDGYGQWVKKWAPWFTVYSNLDVIGAPQATRDNQTYLEEVHGLHPMPVFHTGEPFDVLERYLHEGYTYIALGKLLGNPVSVLRPWLSQCFNMAAGRAVFHGFGMTTWELLRSYPFYTVDSSTWGSVLRFGRLSLFHQARWITILLRDQDALHRNRRHVDAYGIPYKALTAGDYDRWLVGAAAAAAYYRAAAYLRSIHGEVVLPPGKGYPAAGGLAAKTAPVSSPPADGPQGLSIYLADTNSQHWKHAAAFTGGLV